MSNLWVVRAGRNAVHAERFLDEKMMTIGMSELVGAEALGDSRKELMERLEKVHPDWNKGRLANHAGQLFRFVSEIKVGDEVVTYDAATRRYLIGVVSSDARYEPAKIADLPYVRSVEWNRRVPRDALSVDTRNSLGAIQTIFRLSKEASSELRDVAVALDAPGETPIPLPKASDKEISIEELREEFAEKSVEFIEDAIAALNGYEMQDLVAGILRAMGYKTRVSPQGADRGVDVFASPDGLGLQEPRIFVEVKHRKGTSMGATELRAFMGGRQPGDRCLYVSTGGFTKEARYEADRSNIPLMLLALRDLAALLVEHYEAVDMDTRRLVPLKRLYWPVAANN